MTIRKPMLAITLEDFDSINYPVLATPKIDGIRALMVGNNLVSRKFKPIRNTYIREKIEKVLHDGFDGELVLSGVKQCGASFNLTSSAVMSESGTPSIIYHLFDYVVDPERRYADRIQDLAGQRLWDYPFLHYVCPSWIHDYKQLLKYEATCLAGGYEGIIIRDPDGPYKFGRSTLREGYMLKLKRFTDSEAIVLGFEGQMHNANEAEKDAFGRTKRSQAQAGMVLDGTLGKLYVRDLVSSVEFEIGTGFDDATRQYVWDNQADYIGKIVKYKYQRIGMVDKPRFPVFLGWRYTDDI